MLYRCMQNINELDWNEIDRGTVCFSCQLLSLFEARREPKVEEWVNFSKTLDMLYRCMQNVNELDWNEIDGDTVCFSCQRLSLFKAIWEPKVEEWVNFSKMFEISCRCLQNVNELSQN